MLLEPLAPEETGQLIENLAHLDDDLRARILDSAEGNPLYVEEMVAFVAESGGGEITVPPTIQACLAARLDQLDAPERDVLERGSVGAGCVKLSYDAENLVARSLYASLGFRETGEREGEEIVASLDLEEHS